DVNAANCTINETKDDKIDYFEPNTPLDKAISFGINKNKTILKKQVLRLGNNWLKNTILIRV
ncbi:hypothetical protein OLP42_04655, partial [Campylobacter jejuni]|nr:hypothetical protein [Campylobacter jejuni]